MAFLDHEEFRVLFLDKKNQPTRFKASARPIMRLCIPARSCAAPSSSALRQSSSSDDIHLTHQIIAVGKSLKVAVHDHLIIGKHGHASLKGLRLIYTKSLKV